MAEELHLPRRAWDPKTESFSDNPPPKRVRLSSPPISSDPAFFSSDDDPSVDNYHTQERHKKKFRGPWYRQRPALDEGSLDSHEYGQKKSKRKFERQFDSGVFMGSDGTDMDDATEEFEPEPASLPLRQPRVIQTQKAAPTLEELAQGQIQRCLEDGDESIDLSSRGLTTLSNATMRPLATFTRVPPVTEGVFTRLEPKLKIFLALNQLTTLPGELFNLDRLTVLSLRGNRLRELPPSVGKLSNLKELNLSQNGLRYLPYEILELFSDKSRLNSLHLHPNLFHEPQFPASEVEVQQEEEVQYKIGLGNRTRAGARRGAICAVSPDQRRRSWHAQWKITYQARTEVRFLSIHGDLVKGPSFPTNAAGSESAHNRIPVADVNDSPQPPTSEAELSRAPSLLEVALASCAKTPQFPFLADYLPDDAPPTLHRLLADAAVKKESGGSKCTICSRSFIIPRTEWIEWWEIAKVLESNSTASAASPLRQMENERDVLEKMVPLMRRGCSWMCVPEQATIADEADLMVDDE
ncbi:hypothetical protein L207DRAFT_538016 [Hyaloscypha variabilis F]|uniref:L domain-like protein n=1 Tax=Hyaloscypha variabilis (strain UAMH 11265 / GT02V1 / F) TaxID=1149755 RepID=A0A2J6QW11_HYAVF|nr:hypothetical protein L207DRAFT_538016 [Hyaloscypha variabilis F]